MNERRAGDANIQLRRCTLEDLGELIEIGYRTYDETFRHMNSAETMDAYLNEAFNETRIKNELGDRNSEFYFLLANGSLAGYIKINLPGSQTDINDPESLELERIYVRKEYKGRGLGKVLLDHAIRKGIEHRKRYIWLGVWEKNLDAIVFYEKNGFVKHSTHSFRMGDEMQSDYVMKRRLQAG